MPVSLLPMFFFISFVSAIVNTSNFTHSYSQCLGDQKKLLLELKNEVIFDHFISRKLVQWNQTDDNCCTWYGVECDGAGYVISLQLDDETISGGIGDSSSLFGLKYLKKLNLACNRFNYAQIPRGIHNLSYLTHLNLSYAHFGGQVPVELSLLKRLVSLDISNYYWHSVDPLKLEFPNLEMVVHNLSGLREMNLDGVNISSQKSEWPHIISSYLPDLRSLSLRYCSLSGPLDSSLLRLRALSILRLDGNNLSSAVPDFLANFSGLTTLSLTNCSLRGYFPEMIFQIPSLQNLDLSENELLSGTIPPFSTDQSGSLKSLVLSMTNFSGLIPSSISNHKTLSKIELHSCKFTGPIPSTLANLTELCFLDLTDNFLTGSLSSTLFGGLSNLGTLYLGYNLFTGNIPLSLFGLPSLQMLSLGQNQFNGQVEEFPVVNVSNIIYVDLSSNALEGPIPYSLFQLQRLMYLSLSNNLFNGIFQLEKIQGLPYLEVFFLSHNNLSVDASNVCSGTTFPQLMWLGLASCNLHDFPDFIKHSDWSILDLSDNRIAGEIPSWIWGSGTKLRTLNLSFNLLTDFQKPYYVPTSLNLLDLHSNRLQGELHLPFPPNIANLTSYLLFLSVANNSLSGSIPTSLCFTKLLQFLDLSSNKLSGDIPPCLFENVDNLEVFNLGRNNFSGHIPDNLSQNCGLQTFDLHNNTFQGNIPKSLENCKSLELINVGHNIIHDSFPCMLSSNLRVLALRYNRFHGEVRCLKSWPDLQIVDISSNNFSGSLESINVSSWSAMMLKGDPQLKHKRVGSNFLQPSSNYYENGVTLTIKGLEIEVIKIWPDFTVIDMSCNNFQGEIPDAIGHLSSVYLLNLSHNALTGSIPKSFGSLTELESLDISVNQLGGTIPEELARLTFLSFLNLSYNKLVGAIPNGRQFQTFSADSFEGNPGLCLNISCSRTGDNDTSPPENENYEPKTEIEWEYVSAALGYVVGLGSIAWLLLFCRSFRDKYFGKVEEVVEEIIDGRNRRRRHARRAAVRNQGRRRQ